MFRVISTSDAFQFDCIICTLNKSNKYTGKKITVGSQNKVRINEIYKDK